MTNKILVKVAPIAAMPQSNLISGKILNSTKNKEMGPKIGNHQLANRKNRKLVCEKNLLSETSKSVKNELTSNIPNKINAKPKIRVRAMALLKITSFSEPCFQLVLKISFNPLRIVTKMVEAIKNNTTAPIKPGPKPILIKPI